MVAHKKTNKVYIDIAVIVLVLLVLAIFYIVGQDENNKNKNNNNNSVSTSFNKKQYSISNPTSIWVIVNKQRPVNPLEFGPATLIQPAVKLSQVSEVIPPVLLPIAAEALENMFISAQKQNISIELSAGYVPYTYQLSTYNGYLSTKGRATADTLAIRPGYNESQIGLSVDLVSGNSTCNFQTCFASTTAGKWLAANAYKFGYILRYPANKQAITGFSYEPWHYRYVGNDLAAQLFKSGQTMEQFFNLPPAATYKE